jgi:hypothetical protein
MLRQQPGSAGEVTDPPRIHHGQGDPGSAQGQDKSPLEPARRLDNGQGAVPLAGQPGDEPSDSAWRIGEAGRHAGRQQMDVEPVFAHIHPDEHSWLFEACRHHRPRMRACRPIDCSASIEEADGRHADPRSVRTKVFSASRPPPDPRQLPGIRHLAPTIAQILSNRSRYEVVVITRLLARRAASPDPPIKSGDDRKRRQRGAKSFTVTARLDRAARWS